MVVEYDLHVGIVLNVQNTNCLFDLGEETSLLLIQIYSTFLLALKNRDQLAEVVSLNQSIQLVDLAQLLVANFLKLCVCPCLLICGQDFKSVLCS